jgi:hypothetical protein
MLAAIAISDFVFKSNAASLNYCRAGIVALIRGGKIDFEYWTFVGLAGPAQ